MFLSLSHTICQVWYLIVSIPDLCLLLYFGLMHGEGNSSLAVDIIPPLSPNVAFNSISGKACSPTKGGLLLIYATFTRITNSRVLKA